MNPPIRILIVDDHFMARLGLRVPLEREPDMTVIGEARNAAEAFTMYREHLPDVVTMDYRLRDQSGTEAVTEIRRVYTDARIIMLSAFDGEEDIWRAVCAGVCGYLTKEVEREEVIDAVRTVHGGGTVFPAEIRRKIAARKLREPLIPRELHILRLIVQGRSNKEIASDLQISEGLAKLHVSKILEKLGAADRTRAATLAIERGIVHMDEPT